MNPEQNINQPDTFLSKLKNILFGLAKQEIRADIARAKVSLVSFPVYFITLLITIFIYALYQTRLALMMVFLLPPTLAVLAAIIFMIPRRHNPDYTIYPFFHPSKTFKILVILAILAAIPLYFYAQCQAFALPMGQACFKEIFSGEK